VAVFKCMAVAFSIAGRININSGVIASLFTSVIMFTTLIFRVVYGELISFKQAVVMMVITAGVVCISLGKPSSKAEAVEIVDY